MKLKEFAKHAGVTFGKCDPEWGGPISYKMADYPESTICGFKTQNEALEHWLNEAFGEKVAKALKLLLAQTEKARP